MDDVRLHRAFMGHDGRMHSQPGVGTSEQGAAGHYVSSTGVRPTVLRSRHSALSSAQRQAWERRWPELGISIGPGFTDEVAEVAGEVFKAPRTEPLDTVAWFGRAAPLVLEIGSGSGTSTLAMAQDEPGIDVIAVEMYRRGLAQLLCAIDREQVTNVRLIRGEAAYVLEHLIAPGSLSGVRVFFPIRGRRRATTNAGCCSRPPSVSSANGCARVAFCTPRRTTPATPSRSPRSATRNPGCVAWTPGSPAPHCRSRSFDRQPSTRRKPGMRAVKSPN